MDRDLIKGILVGVLIPTIVIGVICLVIYFAGKIPSIDLMSSIVILGIAANAFFANRYHKKSMERESMGVMMTTMIMVLAWAFYFVIF